MSNNPQQDIKEFRRQLLSLVKDAHAYAKVEGINFFVQNFNRQGFLDTSLEAWPKRGLETGGGSILVKSGTLKRSIKATSKSLDVEFYTDGIAPYASIHNEGGEIVVTAKMKRYFWAMFYKYSGKVGRRKSGEMSRSKASVAMNTRALYFRGLAMKRVGSKIKIPKRQFMGESQTLLRNFDTWVLNEIDKRFK